MGNLTNTKMMFYSQLSQKIGDTRRGADINKRDSFVTHT